MGVVCLEVAGMVRVGREHVERDVCIAVVVVGGGGGGGDGGMDWNMRSSSQRRLEYGLR